MKPTFKKILSERDRKFRFLTSKCSMNVVVVSPDRYGNALYVFSVKHGERNS